MPRIVSTVPAVLDAIVATVRAALPGVEVWDGQPVKQTADDVICIAFTGEPDEAAVNSTISLEQMARDPARESYNITCLASSWQGEQENAKTVRDRAYDLVDGVAAALAADQALAGLVMRAMVATQAFAQAQTDRGAVATVQFVIHVDAYTR